MYNNGNDRTNNADEIMRRLMEITGRGLADDMSGYDMNNGFRSIHGVPEGREQDDMWTMPTASQQRPQRPSNGNNMNGNQQRPQRPSNDNNGNDGQMRPQRPENRPPMQENRPPQRPERPPMQENRPPQRPENRPQRPARPEPPRPQPPRPEPQKPMQPCGCMRTGYACVKPHEFEGVNEPHRALKRGTLFKILDLPKNVYEMKEED